MKKYLLLLLGFTALAQNPQPFPNGARLSNITGYPNTDISINSTTGGLLIPRMTTTQKEAISSPTMFTQVIDVTLGKHQYYDGSVWVDSFGGGSQNIKQTLDNGNTALGVGMELIEDGTDPFNPIGGYIKITDSAGNYTNITGGGFGVQEFGTFQNTAYSFNGFSNLSETGNTQVLFETPTDYTGTWIFPDLAAGTDRVAGEQWVIDNFPGGGGFQNPATEDLDMNLMNILNVKDISFSGLINGGALSGTNTGDNSPNSTSQPLDSDLTAIAALTTDSFGRGILTQTSAANVRTYIGAGTGNGTVTNVTGVSGETTVANNTTTPVVGISSAYTAARDAVANGKVENNLTASTTVAPSKTAVNGGLALKEDVSNKSDDANLGTSTTLYPTQRAAKVYSDALYALTWQGLGNTAVNNNMVLGTASGSNFNWSAIRNGAQMLIFNNNAIGVGGNVFFTGGNVANNGQLGIGSTTTALSYSRALNDAVDLATLTNSGATSTGRSFVLRSNIGGTTADRFSVLKNGQAEGQPATSPTQLMTLGQLGSISASTIALTKAALNAAYPDVPVGHVVQAKDVTTGPMIYIKNSEAGTADVWLSIVATLTP